MRFYPSRILYQALLVLSRTHNLFSPRMEGCSSHIEPEYLATVRLASPNTTVLHGQFLGNGHLPPEHTHRQTVWSAQRATFIFPPFLPALRIYSQNCCAVQDASELVDFASNPRWRRSPPGQGNVASAVGLRQCAVAAQAIISFRNCCHNLPSILMIHRY